MNRKNSEHAKRQHSVADGSDARMRIQSMHSRECICVDTPLTNIWKRTCVKTPLTNI